MWESMNKVEEIIATTRLNELLNKKEEESPAARRPVAAGGSIPHSLLPDYGYSVTSCLSCHHSPLA